MSTQKEKSLRTWLHAAVKDNSRLRIEIKDLKARAEWDSEVIHRLASKAGALNRQVVAYVQTQEEHMVEISKQAHHIDHLERRLTSFEDRNVYAAPKEILELGETRARKKRESAYKKVTWMGVFDSVVLILALVGLGVAFVTFFP